MPAGGYRPRNVRGKAVADVGDAELKLLGAADERILPPPLRTFGRWLAEKWHRPKAEQLAKLFDITGETWTLPRLNELKQTGAFKEYVVIMHERGLRAAKERMGEISYDAIENLKWAMDACKSAEDYGTMPKITGQIVERAIPRRDDLGNQNVQVNVVFSPRQLAREETAEIEVTATPITPEKADGAV